MTHSLLSALAIWAIGCVIPTPLAPDTSGNDPPHIFTAEPDFAAGLQVHNTSDTLTFKVTAVDVNEGQRLEARLFLKAGESFSQLGREEMTTSTADPTRYRASFDGIQVCALGGADPQKLLYIFVADTAFPMGFTPANRPADFDSHYDFNYWVVVCT